MHGVRAGENRPKSFEVGQAPWRRCCVQRPMSEARSQDPSYRRQQLGNRFDPCCRLDPGALRDGYRGENIDGGKLCNMKVDELQTIPAPDDSADGNVQQQQHVTNVVVNAPSQRRIISGPKVSMCRTPVGASQEIKTVRVQA